MNKYKEKENGLSSFIIRIIAIISMIWSFISASNIEGIYNPAISECMYWFSFTLFAFLLSEGVFNTTNKLLYLRRFLVFTVISEVAYDYYKYGTYWNIKGQSVMLTLFLCLVTMLICDYLNRKFYNTIINIVSVVVLTIAVLNLCRYLRSEFAAYGIFIAMMFYASRNMSYPKLFQIGCMVFFSTYLTIDSIITVTIEGLQYSVPILIFSFLSLILTWFYNYKRGANSLIIKVTFYLIYPLILTIFYFLKNFVLI